MCIYLIFEDKLYEYRNGDRSLWTLLEPCITHIMEYLYRDTYRMWSLMASIADVPFADLFQISTILWPENIFPSQWYLHLSISVLWITVLITEENNLSSFSDSCDEDKWLVTSTPHTYYTYRYIYTYIYIWETCRFLTRKISWIGTQVYKRSWRKSKKKKKYKKKIEDQLPQESSEYMEWIERSISV